MSQVHFFLVLELLQVQCANLDFYFLISDFEVEFSVPEYCERVIIFKLYPVKIDPFTFISYKNSLCITGPLNNTAQCNFLETFNFLKSSYKTSLSLFQPPTLQVSSSVMSFVQGHALNFSPSFMNP